MKDWLITVVVLFLGFIAMVTGFIEYLFLGWLGILLILVVFAILGRIWGCFRIQNDK